jgi:hypothetical protein
VGIELWRRVLQRTFAGGWSVTENAHYGDGYRLDDWGVLVLWDGKGDASGTVFVEIRQESLPAVPAEELHGLLADFRTARLDLVAVDKRVLVTPLELYDGVDGAQTRTRRDGWDFRSSNRRRDELLRVGSRVSERMGRFYSREKNTGVRHELEFKGDLARRLADEMLAGASVESLYAREHGALVSWPLLPGWMAWRASWAA